MPRVNIVKQIKIEGRWVLRSIPGKEPGEFDRGALPDGYYLVAWYENGRYRREVAGVTSAQALDVHRKRRHELDGRRLGLTPELPDEEPLSERPPQQLIDRYVDQVETPMKKNTRQKYDVVLKRLAQDYPQRTLDSIEAEELNEFVVARMRKGMSANTVVHNVIIISQFFRRNGRPGLARELRLPQRVSTLAKEYGEETLSRLFGACTPWEQVLFSTFLFGAGARWHGRVAARVEFG